MLDILMLIGLEYKQTSNYEKKNWKTLNSIFSCLLYSG